MCTLTWRVTPDSYQILFNRDEQRSRSIAVPPSEFIQSGRTALMPIDPDGQGSWIACNDSGLSLCLLNYYQGIKPVSVTQSRGQLVRQLAYCQSEKEVLIRLINLDWDRFPPFTLVIFDDAKLKKTEKVLSIIWDGIKVKHVIQSSPLTSSSYEFESVKAARQTHYNTLNTDKPSLLKLMAYQLSHIPQRSAHSVCMHREDAHTVSLTIINVERDLVSMDYHQGSPCLAKAITTVSCSKKQVVTHDRRKSA